MFSPGATIWLEFTSSYYVSLSIYVDQGWVFFCVEKFLTEIETFTELEVPSEFQISVETAIYAKFEVLMI